MSKVQTGEAAPPPPPPVFQESETMEPVPFANQIWDIVTLYGPLSPVDAELKYVFPSGEIVREYARWHGIAAKNKATNRTMEHDMFERALAHGVERGWLVMERGKIKPGDMPPNHRPLARYGTPEVAARRLREEDEAAAYKLLTTKNGARNMRIIDKPGLKRSLAEIGQMYPIIRWRPHGDASQIIVDGQTRLDCLTELDIEPEFTDLPRGTSALEALRVRIHAEQYSSVKDLSPEARNAYVVKLAEAGFNQKDIGRQVDLSQSQVSKILSTVFPKEYRGQPSKPDEDEFRWLSEAGWTVRAIAERTGWSKSTVQNYLDGTRVTPERRDPRKRTPGRKPVTANSVPMDERQTIQEKHYVEGKSIHQVAMETGKAENTVLRYVDVPPMTPAIAKAKAKAEAEEAGSPDLLTPSERIALRAIIDRFPKDEETPCLRRFLSRLG